MRKPVLATVAATVLMTVGLLSGASSAYASDDQPAPAPDREDSAPNAIPSGLASPLGDFMTQAQMDAIPSSDGGVSLTFPAVSSDPSAPVSVSSSRCRLDPGIMWSRSSGSGYRYGTIGSKPRLVNCTPDVKKTGMSSEVWKSSGWTWIKVAGPFNSYGTSNMEQKSVQYVCANKNNNSYKVITTAWGTNSRGQTGVGRDSTGPQRFSCG